MHGSQMQRHCRAGNMAGVGLDSLPLRATHFKCMTECKKTGANGYLAECKHLTGKDRTQVLRYFLYAVWDAGY